MKIFSILETQVGRHYKIDYSLARQLILIHENFLCRFLDATIDDINSTVVEDAFVFDQTKAPTYNYHSVPDGIKFYLSQPIRHNKLSSFIDWFFANKQQPADYLFYGVLKDRTEKRGKGEDRTNMETEYGGTPIDIQNSNGRTIKSFARKF